MYKVTCGVEDAPASVVDAALTHQVDDGVFFDPEYVVEMLDGKRLNEDEMQLLDIAFRAVEEDIAYMHLYC